MVLGRRGARGERGAAAVEFALLVPVLVLIVLGTIDWGYFFYVQQVVTNAAREGARVASLTPYTADDPDPGNALAAHDAEAAAHSYLTNAGLTGAAVVDVTSNLSVRVAVSYPTGSITGFLPILPATARAIAEMRR